MATFRTAESEARYQTALKNGALEKGCPLCEREPSVQFTYWKIVPNAYPYDRIAKRHDMLVPLRHATERELTKEELEELESIKGQRVHKEYEYIVESTHAKKSIPAHFHLHLIDAAD